MYSKLAVLEIVVGHRTFSDQNDICLNNFGFGQIKCPNRNYVLKKYSLVLSVTNESSILFNICMN